MNPSDENRKKQVENRGLYMRTADRNLKLKLQFVIQGLRLPLSMIALDCSTPTEVRKGALLSIKDGYEKDGQQIIRRGHKAKLSLVALRWGLQMRRDAVRAN